MYEKIFKEETTHLYGTLQKLQKAKTGLENMMEELGAVNLARLQELRESPETSGTDFFMFLQQLHEKNESFNLKDKVQRLEEFDYLLKEPYFARLDFEDGNSQTIYIGKFGYTEDKPIITDWRARIASIYYRYRYPQKGVKYQTPDGVEVALDLNLKRTFEIDSGELTKYYNNDIQFDESSIITKKLEQRTGGVLEDIIETIQESQLNIIESDPRKICIVQGCVGSGKSTVAIHKLSHVFFNFSNIISPERSILIAKSGILISYLATLFPKLGVFDINYKTLRDLVYNLIFREELKINFDLDKNIDLSGFGLEKINALRKEINTVHHTYDQKIQAILKNEDFESFDSFVYSRNQSVIENVDEFISDLNEELNFQKEKIKDSPKSIKAMLWKENISNLRKLIKKLQRIKADITEKEIKDLAKTLSLGLTGELGYKETLIYLYIWAELVGFKASLKYQYCVIDEGQDFSVLEYLLLGKLVLNGRFCILGDLNQSYEDDGLTTWDLVKEVISEAKTAETFQLETNYRSTKQIIELANSILKPYTNEFLPKSIERIGEEPMIKKLGMFNDVINDFETELTKDLKDLSKSIGIICFDKAYIEVCQNLFKDLQKDLEIPAEKFITLDNTSRPSYIPKGVYLTLFENCKGLEFAKVHVLGLNLDSIKDFQSAKRAFVAVTRAMNELHVYSANDQK